jgi:hypothetical protein
MIPDEVGRGLARGIDYTKSLYDDGGQIVARARVTILTESRMILQNANLSSRRKIQKTDL